MRAVCFKGKFEKDLDFYKTLAIKRGWIPSEKIDKNLSCIVTPNIWKKDETLNIARTLGIAIISLVQWMELIKN